jgi:hypothetical protein
MAGVSNDRRGENQRRALRFHRLRFAWRLFWPLTAIAVTLMPSMAAGNPLAAAIVKIATNALLQVSPLAPMLAVPAMQLALIFFLALYMFATDVRWDRDRHAATQSVPAASATGYLDATEAINGASYVAVATGLFGALAIFAVLSPAQLSSWTSWVQILFGVVLLWLGLRLARRYVCGSVFAPQMMALTEMSGPEGISRTAAMERIRDTSQKIRSERPECFYHNGKRRPSRRN